MGTLFRVLAGIVVLALIAATAGYFYLRRPDIPYDTLEAKYGGATSHYADLSDGLRVHYRDQGNSAGPVLVLVHGFGASLHTWEPWVERLGFNYRIITLDLPGHGLTRAPADYQASTQRFVEVVDAVTTQLGVTRFTLGGNSMGGGVAWNYALAHPDKLTGLILVNSGGLPRGEDDRGGPPPLIFALINNPIAGPLIRDLDNRPLVERALSQAFVDQSKINDAMVDRYVEMARAPGHRGILLSIDQDGAEPSRLPEIRTPTLVIHGDTDRLIPVDAGRRFAAEIPGAELVIYPNVGHVPMEEIPDESAAAVAAFLERVNAPAPAVAAQPAGVSP